MGGFIYEKVCFIRTVNCNWNGDGWNVNANEVSLPNPWNVGNQIFSRNYYFSPVFTGVFCFRFS